MTKYTAKYMLAEANAKMDNDSTSEALKLVPIPELKEDFSNYDHWHHTVFFHLEYYGLVDLVAFMKDGYSEGPLPEHFNTAADWHRWQRHSLHAHSIIYSQAVKVIEKYTKLQKPYYTYNIANYCPHELLNVIWRYKVAVRG